MIAIHVRIAMFMLLCRGGAAPSPATSPPVFSRMHSEGFPFIVWGSGGWTRVRRQLVGASFSRCFRVAFRVVNSLSIGEAAKPRVFCSVDVAVSIGEAAKPRVFCYVDVAVSIGEAAKPRVFCYVDVAVSIGEAGNLVSFATWMSPCL